MMIGRVDEVDGHFVATRFVALAVPTECLYVSRKSPRSTIAGSTSQEVRIQTEWRSVALGYGRVWLPVLAVALPIVQAGFGKVHATTWLLSAVLLALSAYAHRLGKLPEREKARLRVLGTVTGLRIDPSKLPPSTREITREALGELMDKGGIPTTPDAIVSVLEDIPMPAMPLVYGYACYAGDSPEWRECATLVYQRYEQGDF